MWSPRGRSAPDACPGALRVHVAADGNLARVRVPGGRLHADQLAALAAAASELGDGGLELTSRGNVQLRGLPAGAERELAARLWAAGLLPSETHERVRNVIASTLSGRAEGGRFDLRTLVDELDQGLCADPALAELPGRFLFTVDDGRGDVTGFGADVGLFAVASDTLAVLLGGTDTGVRLPPAAGAGTALRAARAFLAEYTAQGGTAWRLTELDDGVPRVAHRLRSALDPAFVGSPGGLADAPAPTRPPVGRIAQIDGRLALALMVPLGRLTLAQVDVLEAAARAGAHEINITPWRTVVVPDLGTGEAERRLAALTGEGLVADTSAGWVGVTGCTGRPGCAKALADVRADANRVHPVAAPGPAGLPVHWVGCERRCGRPVDRHVEVLATVDGYQVSLDGRPRSRSATLDETAAAIAAARRGT
ncbi:precorrin-3B synthase [Micromonospora pisi]|uniref:precorrin-3B synthase n=1 Tax=Micromonospora pisi TaxID=589240 RepID=UPI001FE636D2|nr:precorrin-3B synthase [Micromonospora pisi]